MPSDPPQAPGNSKPPMLAPDLKKLVAGDCQVTLTWEPRSDATRFRIRRRWGSPEHETLVKSKDKATTFEDKVPGPGKYVYTVIAEKGSGNNTVTKESNRRETTVKSLPSCAGEPKYKQIYFQPLDVELKDANYKRAALFVDINGIAGRRIPDRDAQYLLRGEWKEQGVGVYPAPASLYLNPDEDVVLWMSADACPSKAPPDPKISKVNCDTLADAEERYPAKELVGKANRG